MEKISNTRLIWNIFSWIGHFDGEIKVGGLNLKGSKVFIETQKSSYTFSLEKTQELLAVDCLLTWWANMGIDNNRNENGENIFDFDLTKKKNRDKFTV